jgi:ABC-type nitrate/sulfonate/bicarbonate transport system substrate-binding protein
VIGIPGARRTRLLALVLLLAAACAAGLFLARGPHEGRGGEVGKLRLGLPRGPTSAELAVAWSAGLLAERGLVTEMRSYPNGRAAFAGLLADEVDIAVVGDLPLAFTGLTRSDFVILAMLGTTTEDRWLVTRKTGGVASAADLAGRRVATQVKSGSHYVLERVLRLHGVSPGDVTVVDMPPDDMPGALLRGDVAAFAIHTPFADSVADHFGPEMVELRDPDAYRLSVSLVARRSVLGREGALAALIEGVAEAEGIIAADRDRAIGLLARSMGLRREVAAERLEGIRPRLSLDGALTGALEEEGAWFLRVGKMDRPGGPPSYRELIEPRYLRAAKPEAVRLTAP